MRDVNRRMCVCVIETVLMCGIKAGYAAHEGGFRLRYTNILLRLTMTPKTDFEVVKSHFI